jgi:DNA gyrase inhibitor GyrI
MCSSAISIETVTPWPLASVRRQVTMANRVSTIIAAPVWSLAEKRGLPTRGQGQTVVVYHDDGTGLIEDSPDGVAIDVGVLVAEPFEGDSLLQCTMTPGGRVARLRHQGDYDKLPALHEELRQWCRDQGHAFSGLHWVRYSHWHENPAQRVTDIYYLLD